MPKRSKLLIVMILIALIFSASCNLQKEANKLKAPAQQIKSKGTERKAIFAVKSLFANEESYTILNKDGSIAILKRKNPSKKDT